MRRSRRVTVLLATSALVAGGLATAGATASASPPTSRPSGPRPAIAHGLYRSIAAKGSTRVLVLTRGNAAVAHPDTAADAASHAAAVRREQAPVTSLLARAGAARDVHAFKSFDIVSAKVTKKGLDALAASPDVSRVIPDSTIREAPPATSADTSKPAHGSAKPADLSGGACSSNRSKPQLEPEALQTTETDSQDPSAETARSLGATGAGVKVAFFAEGIDVNNPDFIRPDGSKVFTDYQDFTGDGTSAPTDAGEAFIDASSIAAQANETYNVQHFSDLPSSTPCYIKVEGVAPGASLADMKVFNEDGLGITSWILEGIDWAVNHDHVNILSQSLGNTFYPDTANDAFRRADAAAIAAGVTVVGSSGDSGITNTVSPPGTQPGVIDVGATTTLRLFAQTGYGGANFPGISGWLNDNISALSSGGENDEGRTVDMVAPGELGWALCTPDLQQYFDCASYAGNPSPVEAAGGTSESAPLVAGGAALVIQAYRQHHGGATPSPALVQRILVSSAKDIDAPADQQGAGELDTYKAVLLARSIHTSDGAPAAQGNTLVTNSRQIDVAGDPGSAVSKTITVTNTGSSTQTVHLGARTLGQYSAFHPTTVTLSDSSPTITDFQDHVDPYQKVTFTVPAGQSRLDTSIAYHGASTDLSARGRLALVDPNGDFAGYSLPQGVGNYGDVQVRNPVGGTWTAYVYSRPTSDGGSEGKYIFGWRTAKFTSGGSVSPSTLNLAPGKSGTFTYTTTTPSQPGDRAASIVVTSAAAGPTTIPVVLRSYIPFSTNGTPFHALLTGGNGRGSNGGAEFYYQVSVPAGTPVLNAAVKLANNPNNPFYLSLIDPHGDQVGAGSNLLQTTLAGSATPELAGVAHVVAPSAGTWDVIVNFAGQVSGDALSQPFTVLVNGKQTPVTAPGLPDSSSTTLPAGQATTVNVHVTNNSAAPQAYFVDPRKTGTTTYTLAGTDTTGQMPSVYYPMWTVPTDTVSATSTLNSSVPVEFDWAPLVGDPDIESNTSGNTAASTYTAPAVPQGLWYQEPSEVGPSGAAGKPQVTGTSAMTVVTRPFDTQVTSSTGDLWPVATNANAPMPNVVVVQPGASTTIPVTIKPTGAAGSTVSGTLFVDDLQLPTSGGVLANSVPSTPSADQVAGVPYSYTIGG